MAAGKVTISTALDNKGFARGAKQIIQDADGFAKNLGGSVSKGTSAASSALSGLKKLIAGVLSVTAIIAFGKASVQAAQQFNDAMTGMQSILDGQGRSFSAAQGFIDDYIKDGLVPATDAITAYKNLALRGYDDSQIQSVMVALKDAAAYGRQASYSMGEAVSSATEGLKNENSILVDNAGVTKNVAKMWEEYARSIGTTAANLTQQQKIQAEVNGIMAETRFQTGDAAKVAGTFSGQVMQLQFGFNNLKIAVGNALIPILRAVLPAVNAAISALTRLFNVFSQVTAAIFGSSASEMRALEENNAAVADAAYAGAEGENALGSATKKAAKAAKGALASFDELNVLQEKTADTGADAGTGGASSGGGLALTSVESLAPKEDIALPWLEALKDKIAELTALFAPSLRAWGQAFSNLKAPIAAAVDIIGKSLSGLWNDGLAPLGAYIITDFIPSIVNGFSETFAPIFSDVMSVAIIQFALDFQWMCATATDAINTMFLPALENLKNIVLDIFDGIKQAWEAFGSNILTQWETFKESIRTIFTNIYETIIKPVFGGIGDTLTGLWNEHLKPLWDNITLFVGALVETVLAFWNNVLAPFVNWFIAVFGPVIAGVVNNIGKVFGTIYGMIADIIGGLLRAMRGILEFLTGVFTGDWEKSWTGIKDFFGGIWDAILGLCKGTVNSVIDVINGLVWGVCEGINVIIRALNSLSFDIPSWVPFVGGNKFGLNIPTITAPQIPRLAAGAVIPPNREFMAVLGDQKSGTNIEAPLETIIEAMRLAMTEVGGRDVTIRFAGNLAELVRLLKPYIDKENSRVGGSLITQGAY